MIREFGVESIINTQKTKQQVNKIAKNYAGEGEGKIIKIYYMY